MDSSNLSLGQKIKKYRLRSNKSQLDLELETGLSTGTISRIENGAINPTKETLLKLIDILGLNGFEAASLFNIEVVSVARLISLTNNLNTEDSLMGVLQRSVDDIVSELDLHGSVIALIEKDKLHAITVTNSWYADLMFKIIGKRIDELSFKIKNNEDNFFVRAIKENKSFVSEELLDFTKGAFPSSLAPLVQRLTHHGSGIVFPLYYKGKPLGGIMFSKSYKDDFVYEYEVLESFSNAVANAISRFGYKLVDSNE